MSYVLYLGRKFRKVMKVIPWTIEYPEVLRQVPVLSRSSLRLNARECTGCRACEDRCPTKAIELQTKEFSGEVLVPKSSKGIEFERWVEAFQIDYGKCIFCGICVDACTPFALTTDRQFLKPCPEKRLLRENLIKERGMRFKWQEN